MSHIRCVNFPGYEKVAVKYGLSAAVCVPAGARLIVTSGHVGLDDEMNMKVDLQEQMDFAFKNVEKSIRACEPDLTSDQIWGAVYQVTSYHVGGVDEKVTDLLASVAEKYMGEHRPAWAAVGVETLAAGLFEMSVSAALPGDRHVRG